MKAQITQKEINQPKLCFVNHVRAGTRSSLQYFPGIKIKNSNLGDNCIQNSHLGRYIVGFTVGNLVLRRRVSGAVKRDFRTYI